MDNEELQTCLNYIDSAKPLGDWADKPAVPATTVTATNDSGFPMTVYVIASGATITAITVDGVATGLITGTVRVRNGSTIALAYSGGTPTWKWFYE